MIMSTSRMNLDAAGEQKDIYIEFQKPVEGPQIAFRFSEALKFDKDQKTKKPSAFVYKRFMLPTVTSKKKFEPEMGPQPEKKKKKRKATKRIYVDTHKMPQEIIEEEN